MYNFVDFKLKPHVTASCPCTDGYEVENLTSDNSINLSKGFLAYSAIKPPVDVDFKFICPVKIYFIVIWTCLDSQQSTGIEFLISNSNSDFFTISKVYSDNPIIVICNRKYYSIFKKYSVPENFTIQFCRSNQYKLITCTEKLRLKIIRTKSSVPCIKKIEIWGDISRICSDTTKNTIKQLISRVDSKDNILNHKNVNNEYCSNIHQEHLFNIPEEFIDPISCEMISLPMTLPSGKTIDQHTLEKYQEFEAKWGRSPSDPFTGLIFTAERKPVLNSALKSRIDEFLIKNSHRKETFQIQRTLGSKKKVEADKTTKLPNDYNLNTTNINHHEIQSSSSSSTSSSLDDLINNAMVRYNIVCFTSESSQPSEINDKKCGGICNSKMNLYILECKHFICRQCLLKKSNLCCEICKTVICKANVKKFNL